MASAMYVAAPFGTVATQVAAVRGCGGGADPLGDPDHVVGEPFAGQSRALSIPRGAT